MIYQLLVREICLFSLTMSQPPIVNIATTADDESMGSEKLQIPVTFHSQAAFMKLQESLA